MKVFGMIRVLLAAATISTCVFNAYAASAAKQIESTGDPRLDGILSNVTWSANALTFAFPAEPIELQPAGIKFEPLPDEQRIIIRAVFKQLEAITQLNFSEVEQAKEPQLTFARWDQPSLLGRVNALFQSPGGGDGSTQEARRGYPLTTLH